eukprot:g32256.t1
MSSESCSSLWAASPRAAQGSAPQQDVGKQSRIIAQVASMNMQPETATEGPRYESRYNVTYLVAAECRDVKCGKIQCKGGNSSPVRGGNVHYSTTEFVINGVQMKCRGTFSNLPDSISPDLIRQGTKCGDKK